jgi:hypothetical protein
MSADGLVSVLVLSAVALLIAVPLITMSVRARRRTKRLQQIAQDMRFTFMPQDHGALVSRLSPFSLSSNVMAQKAVNVIEGTVKNVQVVIFDHHYAIETTDGNQTTKQTVICFTSPDWDLPAFGLRPRNFLHTFASYFGLSEVAFDGHRLFAKRYLLQGKEEDAIRDLFREEVLSFFDGHGGLFVEGCDRMLILYRSSQRVEPDNIRAFLQEGLTVADLFP